MRRLLSYQQVAEILGCGIDKVRELCDLGKLERLDIGYRTKRVTQESLDIYLERLRAKGQAVKLRAVI